MTTAARSKPPLTIVRGGYRFLGPAFVLLMACLPRTAAAHDVRGSAIYLDLGRSAVGIELHLPVRQLLLALDRAPRVPPAALAEMPSIQEYVRNHLHATSRDGSAMTLVIEHIVAQKGGDDDELVFTGKLLPVGAADVRQFALQFDAILHQVVTHNAYVFLRRDIWHGALGDKPELLGMLHWQRKQLSVERAGGSAWRGIAAAFTLGTHHIAEGTDHLLFLLMLLLPAPLYSSARAWGKPRTAKQSALAIVKLVSAFTLGHSLTLIAGALRGAALPVQPVECLIAASIVFSGAHALRPVFPGREVFVAAAFGLVHGFAFASALSDFGFDTTSLAVTLLGFNLGIEAMQLAVVLLVMPWLTLASQHKSYAWLRVIGASFGISAGLSWIAQRALGVESLVTTWTEQVAAHALWGVLAVAVYSVAINAPALGQLARERVRRTREEIVSGS
jgi:hypothetical protein